VRVRVVTSFDDEELLGPRMLPSYELPVVRKYCIRTSIRVGHALQPWASACLLGPGIPHAPPTRIRPKPTGHCLPPGGRVIATPVLGGLHHEYQLVREAQ
jgi:hypothetical protein